MGSADSGEALLRRMAVRRRRENVLVAVVAVLAVVGGGHAIVDWFTPPPAAPSDAATVGLIGHSKLAESFARDFVVTYLSATSDQQERIAQYVGAGQQISLPSNSRQVSDPEVVHSTREQAVGNVQIWSVTVSVRLGATTAASGNSGSSSSTGSLSSSGSTGSTSSSGSTGSTSSSSSSGSTSSTGSTTGSGSSAGAGSSGKGGPERQYYRVPVALTDGLRALSVPAAVEAPGQGSDLALTYSASCPADTPFAQVASGFVKSYLTADGDLSRYTTPDAQIVAPAPHPFATVETASVTTDDAGCGTTGSTAGVLVTVNPKGGPGGAVPTLAYPLTLTRTAGQWQVQSLDQVPNLRQPLTVLTDQKQGTGASAATTAPATTTAAAVPPATQN